MERVVPEAVTTNDAGYKSLKYANLTAILVEAIKELKQEKDAGLKEKDNEIARLKEELEDKEKRLTKLEEAVRKIQVKVAATENNAVFTDGYFQQY